MDEVEAAMGSAQRIPASTPNVWWYQNSSITFQNGRVVSWNNASGNIDVKANKPAVVAIKPAPPPVPRAYVRPVAPVYYYDADDLAEVERINMQDEAEEQRRMIEEQEDRINQLQSDQDDLERKMRRLND